MAGVAAFTVRLSVAVPVWPVELLAERAMLNGPDAVGVPEMTAPLRVRPAGRPVALKLAAVGLDVIV